MPSVAPSQIIINIIPPMGNCQKCHGCFEQPNQIEISNHTLDADSLPPKELPNSFLRINIKTWQKDSYSLYDYEGQQNIASQSVEISKDGYLYQKENNVHFKEGKYLRVNNETLLLLIEQESEQLQLLNLRSPRKVNSQEVLQEECHKAVEDADKLLSENLTNNNDCVRDSIQKMRTATNRLPNDYNLIKSPKIWIVTRSVQQKSPKEGLVLQVGDVIKLGRVKLIVKHIEIDPSGLIQEDSVDSLEDHAEVEKQCRICLSTAESNANPLVDPCQCSGSAKYVHIKCLLTWLKQRMHAQNNQHCMIFLWKGLECEICKQSFPRAFEIAGQKYDVVELCKPHNKPYILLEYLQKKPNEDSSIEGVGYYIINFGSKHQLRVGRNHEVEVSINDISVSRMHAMLKLVNNQVILQDMGSKFGTLVQLQNNLQLSSQLSGLELQVKRTLFHFEFSLPANFVPPHDFESCLGR